MKQIFVKLYSFLVRKVTHLTVRHVIITLLFISCLLPVWLFKYFPSQDGPEHLHSAYVLKDYHNPESQTIREHYRLKIQPVPNWGSQGPLLLLMYIFPPLLSEKITLTFIIGLFIISIFYFLHSVNHKHNIFALVAFIFCHNYLLYMGFYGFYLSMSLCFFALGYGWKHRRKLTVTNLIVLYLLFAITYFAHILSFALLILSWLIISITLARKPKTAIRFVAVMIPAYIVMLIYLLTSVKGLPSVYWSLHSKWTYFTRIGSLIYFTDAHRIVTIGLWAIFGMAFLLTVWYDKIKKRKLLAEKDLFLLIFFVVMGLYFVSPWSFGSGAWINDRFNLYMFLMLLPWLTVEYHKYIRRGLTICLILLSVIHLGITLKQCYLINLDLKHFRSGMPYVAPHSTVSVAWSNNNWNWGPHSGTLKYASPFIHAGGYYCMSGDRVHMENYQATSDHMYFPVKFRYARLGFSDASPSGAADYVILRNANDRKSMSQDKFIQQIGQVITPPGIVPILRTKQWENSSFFIQNLSKTRIWSNTGTKFLWSRQCLDTIWGDHIVREGWQGYIVREDWHWPSWPKGCGYIAHGKAMIHDEIREGLIMLANPDKQILSAEWQVDAPSGSRLKVEYGLTDRAAKETSNGMNFKIITVDSMGVQNILVNDTINPKDNHLREYSFVFKKDVKAIRFVHDNLESQLWDTLYIDPQLEIAK